MKKYDNFCKALANLQEGAKLQAPYSIVEQTGIVGLFSICFEQSWKLMKEVLESHGRFENKIGSPKGIMKAAFQCNMIEDEGLWLEILKARDILAHTYSDQQPLEIIEQIKNRYVTAFEHLKQELDERWLNI